jgi:hypothetical protein
LIFFKANPHSLSPKTQAITAKKTTPFAVLIDSCSNSGVQEQVTLVKDVEDIEPSAKARPVLAVYLHGCRLRLVSERPFSSAGPKAASPSSFF